MSRLVLTRAWNEEIVIGDPLKPAEQITIKLTKIPKGAKLICEGPRDVQINRREVVDAIVREAQQ
jgi:sRNA-binding carbon storage regulator CsrA